MIEEPGKISPIHFRASNNEEHIAYQIAYREFLKYFEHDEQRAQYFWDMLYSALFERNTRSLVDWYELYKMRK